VRDASTCPRCCPWCRHARTRPTLPLSTSQTNLPAATSSQVLWPMWAGVEAAEEAARVSRCRRPASTGVLGCCEQPGRAAVAGTTRARAQVLRPAGPSEAGPRPAMQPLGSLREAQGGTQAAVRDRHQNPTHYHRYHRRVSECYSSLYIYLYTERPCEPVREPNGAVGTIGGARAERLHVYTARYSPKPRYCVYLRQTRPRRG
jgi:hypothetical protein